MTTGALQQTGRRTSGTRTRVGILLVRSSSTVCCLVRVSEVRLIERQASSVRAGSHVGVPGYVWRHTPPIAWSALHALGLAIVVWHGRSGQSSSPVAVKPSSNTPPTIPASLKQSDSPSARRRSAEWTGPDGAVGGGGWCLAREPVARATDKGPTLPNDDGARFDQGQSSFPGAHVTDEDGMRMG